MPYQSLLPQTTPFGLQGGDPKWAQAQIKNETRSNKKYLKIKNHFQSNRKYTSHLVWLNMI